MLCISERLESRNVFRTIRNKKNALDKEAAEKLCSFLSWKLNISVEKKCRNGNFLIR